MLFVILYIPITKYQRLSANLGALAINLPRDYHIYQDLGFPVSAVSLYENHHSLLFPYL